MSVCSLGGHAQFNLSGKVLDAQTKEPLAGATVQCVEQNQNAIADVGGKFNFKNLFDLIGQFCKIVIYNKVSSNQSQRLQTSHNAAIDAHLVFNLQTFLVALS